MRFKVVVCSRCARARGVRTDSRTASCNKCGNRIDVPEARAYLTTDSQAELAKAVADLNARLQGGIGRVSDLQDDPGIARRSRADTIRDALFELVQGAGTFTLEEAIRKVATARGVDVSEVGQDEVLKVLDMYKERGLVFEKRDGLFERV